MDDDDDDEDDDNDDDKPEDGHETSDKKKTAAPNEVDEEQPAETENNTDNNNNSDNNAVKASVAFASPEGEMNEFNDRVVDEPTETSSTAKAAWRASRPVRLPPPPSAATTTAFVAPWPTTATPTSKAQPPIW